jgi:hypothetical protein
MPLQGAPDRISPNVIFCERMAHQSAATAARQILNLLWVETVPSCCVSWASATSSSRLRDRDAIDLAGRRRLASCWALA